MSRKKLPKAIAQSKVELPEAGDRTEANEDQIAHPRRGLPQISESEEGSTRHPASASTALHESPSQTALSPPERELLHRLPPDNATHAAKRRAFAEKIVQRYKLYAALGGLSPLPLVTAAGVTAVILRMVKSLSNLYQVPFQRDRARSAIAGLMGGAVPAGLGVATASTLALALPGVGFVGVAVASLAAAAATERIGLVFIERFEQDTA